MSISGDYQKEQLHVLEVLALFQPLGMEGIDKKQYDFVKESDTLCRFINTAIDKSALFEKVIRDFEQKQLIERKSNYLILRPRPLACWLISKWFSAVGADGLVALLAEISKLDGVTATALQRAMCRRLQYMQDSSSAMDMIDILTRENAVFRKEEIVCSKLGSQLFLAMSTVNPIAISRCLYEVLFTKSAEWLHENIADDIRRNYVWALEKLCFCKDSFNLAAHVMAKLAVAENESWANNATSQFLQLFHIGLPGTSASLIDRLHLIESLQAAGEEFQPIVAKAIGSAFSGAPFGRSGGGEDFGFHKFTDYSPSQREMEEYWEGCLRITQKMCQTSPAVADLLADAITSHAREIGWQLSRKDILYSLIECIVNAKGNYDWPKMYEQLRLAKSVNEKKDDATLDMWIERFRKKDFASRLMDAHKDFYRRHHSVDFESARKKSEAFFFQYVDEFKTNRLYVDLSVVETLIKDQGNVDVSFIRLIPSVLNNEQLDALLQTILSCLAKSKDLQESGFICILLNGIENTQVRQTLLENLLKDKLYSLYVAILSDCETEQLDSLNNILSALPIEVTYLQTYLRRAPLYSATQMWHTCNAIKQKVSAEDYENLAVTYISHRTYSRVPYEEPMLGETKNIVLNFVPTENNHDLSIEVHHITEDLIGQKEDAQFSVDYTRKTIDNARRFPSILNNRHAFHLLLPKYQNALLEPIIKALAEENPCCWLTLQGELGSDFGFGAGPLFLCDSEKIKNLIIQNKDTELPQRIAHMVPIFDYEGHQRKNVFSCYVLFLLDNLSQFPNIKDVLDGLHANMHTFSWTGSTVPLYKDLIECFKLLLSHKDIIVSEWAAKNIKFLEEEIEREARDEAYRELAFK